MAAQRQALPGARWHFQHGPIDIVIGADGDAPAVQDAHQAAWLRFETVLGELVAELPLLRQPVAPLKWPANGLLLEQACPLQGVVARRMWQACAAHAADFITPMAAVAGAVAQELIALYRRPGVRRAWVNNGGDIALHLGAGEIFRIGLFANLARLGTRPIEMDAHFDVRASDPVRGVATSGWRGRSFSLGIADSVTILAASAAQADAAATRVANAVNVEHAGIVRRPACELKDDSDLGDIAVTVAVPPLPPAEVDRALQAGLLCARGLQQRGLVFAAALVCQGRYLGLQAPMSSPAGAWPVPALSEPALID